MSDTRFQSARLILLAVTLLGFVACGSEPIEPPSGAGPVITLHGAAGEVSGSFTLLEYNERRWLIDCGSLYPETDDDVFRAKAAEASLPVAADSIDAVLLTHAHLDHIGRVPLLVAEGYSRPIYLTRATADLAAVMLPMQIRLDVARQRHWSLTARPQRAWATIHWDEACQWAQRIAPHNLLTHRGNRDELHAWLHDNHPQTVADRELSACRTCTEHEFSRIASLLVIVEYDQMIHLTDTVSATFQPAGHIPGAASIVMHGQSDEHEWSAIFSGDLGNALSPLHAAPRPAPPVDLAVIEATYADFLHGVDGPEDRAAFRATLAKVVARGGIALVPAFAMDRTQKILYEITRAKREGLLDAEVPILVPSPTAAAITQHYRVHQRDWLMSPVADDVDAFAPPGLVQDRAARQMLEGDLPRPSVIVATSAMLDHAASRDLLPRLADDPRNAVLFVGYLAPHSVGHQLRAGTLELFDDENRPVPIRLSVHDFRGFSGHGDAHDIDRWLAAVPADATIVLMHGQTEPMLRRAEQLRSQGYQRIIVAQPEQTIPIPVRAVASH